MNWKRKKNTDGVLLRIPVAKVHRNPDQPRVIFDEGALLALSESIRRYGVLQPISVRKTADGYELIAGERRLRAAAMAEQKEIPALVYAVDRERSAELAIMENLLREDLNIFETAAALDRLFREYGLTQEEIASRLSVSQSYVANKLRLLRFDSATQKRILDAALTERHARALLRLPESAWDEVLTHVVRSHLNVAATEKLVEEYLSKEGALKKKKADMRGVMRDLRFFYNSVDRAVTVMRRSGVHVNSYKEEEEGEIRLVICIAKPCRKNGA